MPLDPSIILGGRPAPIQSPLEAISQVAQLQGLREQTEVRRLAADEARRKAADDAVMRQALTASDGDVDKALPQLYQINPRAAATLQEAVGKARKESLDAYGKQLDTQIKSIQFGAGVFEKVTDQGSYDLAMPWLTHVAPDIATHMGPTYDEGRVAALIAAGTDQKDRLELKKLAIQHLANGDYNRAASTALSAIDPKSPNAAAEWTGTLKALKDQGVPESVLAIYGTYTGPESITAAATRGITPEKRAELAGQAETRAQTAANQAAQLEISRGNLAVAQGHLAVSRAAEARQAAAAGREGAVKLTAAQQEDISTMLTVEQLANDVQAIDKEKGELPGVGPSPFGGGRFFPSARGSGGATGETLRNKIGNIQGTIAKLRGGTSFTPSEQELLNSYTPTITDTDAAIRTKLKNLVDFIQKKRENTLRVARGQYTLPETPKTDTRKTTGKNPFRN